jgi:hypothetical protein
LPYQWQLAPIFVWGFLLSGGRCDRPKEFLSFLLIFLAFHIGCFGGLTALNSFYDQDDGPIGGLWQPPPPPRFLWHFAWTVQLLGLLVVSFFSFQLAVIYTLIVLLALGYSHPLTRWKAHPWKSLAVVAFGQGTLDFTAGTLVSTTHRIDAALLCGGLGSTLLVMGFYPLTQLFQATLDSSRGDRTTALALQNTWGHSAVFRWAHGFFGAGMTCNAWAVWLHTTWWEASLVWTGGLMWMALIEQWRQRRRKAESGIRLDFENLHQLLRLASASFGSYLLVRLILGGYTR